MALWLYRERMLFSDMAFQAFHIIRTGDLQVQSGRFGAVGTQVFPWLAQGAGVPLKGVLMAYSLGHVLYYAAIFGWIMFVLRQWRWGLALVLLSVLMAAHTFYWLSEAPQGLAFLLAVLAWMDTKLTIREMRLWQWPLFLGAMVTAFYFHPMVLYAMVFCCVWLFFYEKERAKRFVWAMGLLLFVALFIIKFKVLPLDWYDAMSLSRAEAFVTLWPHWIDIKSNRDFAQWLVRDYHFLPLFYVANAVALLRVRQWFLLVWSLLFPLGYILLVNIPFHGGDNQFYLENLYLPLVLMVGIPFIFGPMPDWIRPQWLFVALALVVSARIVHIAQTRTPWHQRLVWLEQLLATHAAPKTIIKEKDLPQDLLRFTWGIPYETLLLSSLKGPEKSRLFLQTNEISPKLDSLARAGNVFLGSFRNYRLATFPRQYFGMDTVSAYQVEPSLRPLDQK
jgi:hypothetical protein